MDIEKFMKRGFEAQKAVNKIIAKAEITRAKSECPYDGFRTVFKDGRCTLCGNNRQVARIELKKWEKEHSHYFVRVHKNVRG